MSIRICLQKNNIPAPERNMLYSRFVRDNIIGTVVHYPEYEGSELAKGGFAGVTRILTDGDMRVSSKPKDSRAYTCIDETAPVINISHAESITLITYTDWTDDLGEYCEFRDRVNGKDTFALVDKCINKVNSVNITEEPVSLDHKNIELKLDGGYFCESANEELLDLQKNEYDIMPHLLEKLYYNGLYGMQACAGTTAPRLSGLWVGEWNLLWRSAYTMDANVNIQVSGMNGSGLYEAGVGYMWFILRQIPDWVNNAAMVYGMKDAVLIPVNTDGHRAMMVEYDINYPFQYWNAGAGWMLIPIYEFLQTYGDAVITTDDVALIKMYGKDTFDVRKDVYEPLLKKTYNFWKQIGNPEYYTDTDGNARYEKGKCSLNESEHYLIIPSFSPENKPFGYHSAITANAAMDISAAKDVINMYTEMLNYTKVDGYEQAVSKRLFSRFVNSYKKSFKHWHFIIPTIYGQGEDSNRLIPYTIHSIQQSKTLHFTSGSQVRQYLHVDDAVNALFHAINKALPSGIYNLESTDILSVKEVVSTIFSQLNQPIPNGCFGSTSRSDEKMLYLALDGSKLKSMIGEYQTIVLKNSILCY